MAAGDPGTIAFSTESVGGGSLGVSTSGLNVGVQGGGVAPMQQVNSGSDWFASTGGMRMPDNNLPQFLEEITAPNRKALEQQQMWDGFVAARSGQTMDEISEAQPWYSKLFGPTNFEIGAQNYNVLRSVSEMESDLLNRMPDLRKLPPEALAQEFNQLAQQQMTGNGYADAVLQKTFMGRAGPLMDLHTKERVAWQQSELVKKQYASNSAASTSYNLLAQKVSMLGDKAPADPAMVDNLVQAQLGMLDAVTPSRFQGDESYTASMTAFFRGMADRGEFHTLKLFTSRGVLSALDPDDALQLNSYVKQKQAQYENTWMDANPKAAAQAAVVSIYVAEGAGAEPVRAMMDKLNRQYAAETGSDIPLYSGDEMASGMSRSALAHLAAQEALATRTASANAAAATEQQKLDAKAEDIAAGIKAFRHGRYSELINAPGVAKEMIEANVVQDINALFRTEPKAAMAYLVQNANTGRGAVLAGVADEFKNRARAVLREQPNDSAKQLYNQWRMMKDTKAQRLDSSGNPVEGTLTGATTANLYFGDGVHAMFTQLQTLEESTGNFELAYEVARGSITTADPTAFSAESRKESLAAEARLKSAIQEAHPKYLGYFGNELGDSGVAAASRAIVRVVNESGGLLNTSAEGIDAALTIARHKYGGENAGKYYWENGRDDEGHVIKGVGTWLGFSDTRETGPAIEAAIDDTLRMNNVEPSKSLKTDVFRMRDSESGEPVLYVHTVGERGWKVIAVPGASIKAAYEKRRRSQLGKQVRRETPVPQGFRRMPDGTIRKQ